MKFVPSQLDVEIERNGWRLWIRVTKRFQDLRWDAENSPAATGNTSVVASLIYGSVAAGINTMTKKRRVGLVGHRASPYWTRMVRFNESVLTRGADFVAERDALVAAVMNGDFDEQLAEESKKPV